MLVFRKFLHTYQVHDPYINIANATQLVFTCSKSTVETLEKGLKYVQIRQCRRFGVFIVNFEHISLLFLVLLLLTMNK